MHKINKIYSLDFKTVIDLSRLDIMLEISAKSTAFSEKIPIYISHIAKMSKWVFVSNRRS